MSIKNPARFPLHTLALVLALLALVVPPAAAAAQPDGSAEHLAVILILDDSGSMETNDPNDLRYTDAQLFVSLLDEGDAAGAVRFASTSSQITNGIEVIADPDQHARLVDSLAAVPPDGYTDVKTAFEEAGRMMQSFDTSEYQIAVLFLTDGRPEVPELSLDYEEEALAAARALDVPILSIALTSGAQSPFLNRLASETSGEVIFASSAADLLDTYLQILGDLKDRTVLGSGSTAAPGEAVFPLDAALMPYVDRVSFVVSKPAASSAGLIAPDERQVSSDDTDVRFSIRNQRFEVVTLTAPAGGTWRYQLAGSGSVQARAILYSRLRLQLVSPQSVFEAGQPLALAVKLIEEQPGQEPVTIIGDASFAAWITRPDGARDSLDRFYDDGTHGDILAGDGVYTRDYVNTQQPGVYALEIRGSKGAVPVTYQAQAQAVAFPKPVVSQPLQSQYEIRREAVPLELRLEGAAVNELDRGSFDAAISSPGGALQRVPLTCIKEICSGAYQPAENGTYRVRFEPVDAAYQGLPYLHAVETSFEARLISSVAVEQYQIGLDPSGEKRPRFERFQAQQGIPLPITFSSTSPNVETINARIEDMPGFTLLETDAFLLAAHSSTTVTLHLAADPSQAPGSFQGQLVFSVSEGVDLLDESVQLNFEIYDPELFVIPEVISTPSPDYCLLWEPVRLRLDLHSTSAQEEQIQILLDGPEGATLDRESVTVLPGDSQVEVTILPGQKSFSPGDYSGAIQVSGMRAGLKMPDGTTYPIAFHVDPVWINCQRPLILLCTGAVLTGILMIRLIARARHNNRPPVVSGTLTHWDQSSPDLTMEVNLTALGKTRVKIGKGNQNDIVIPDETLEDEHAEILAEKAENNGLSFTLHPIAAVRKGYREYSSDLPFEENTQYQMGNRIFKFIRDLDLS